MPTLPGWKQGLPHTAYDHNPYGEGPATTHASSSAGTATSAPQPPRPRGLAPELAGLAPRAWSPDSARIRDELLRDGYPHSSVLGMVNDLRTQAGQDEAVAQGVPSWTRTQLLPEGADAAPYTDLGHGAGDGTSTSTVSRLAQDFGSQTLSSTMRQPALDRADLLGLLIAGHNPQDFSGAPLPSGQSVDSQASFPSQTSSQGGVVRTPRPTDRRVAPYARPSQTSGSGTTVVEPIHCKHTPGGVVSTVTFKGCPVTDDELADATTRRRTQNRIAARKSRHEKAENMGVVTTGSVQQAENDARAIKKGFNTRQEAEEAERDARAIKKGFHTRQKAQLVGKDAVAIRKGFNTRQQAHLAAEDARASSKGFNTRQEAQKAAQIARARLQLGPSATVEDLVKTQTLERRVAATLGVDVRELRRQRPDLSAPPGLDDSQNSAES